MPIALSKNALKLVLILLFVSPRIGAQKASVETASIVIKKYRRDGESAKMRKSYLKEAKDYIDKAHKNELTSNDPKMWYVRGRVYYEIYVDTLFKDAEGKRAILDPEAIEISVKSLVSCKKTDKKKKYEDDCDIYLVEATALSFNEGINSYYAKDYKRALRYYNNALDAIPFNDSYKLGKRNVSEDIIRYNATVAARESGDLASAKKNLQVLIDKNYNDPIIYKNIADVSLEQKDTTAALAYLGQGRSVFTDNLMLIREEINMYIRLKRSDELIQKLTDAIEADPYNPIFYSNRAIVYNEKAASYEDNSEAKMADLKKSETDYLKALELDAENFDALTGLGILFVNQGVDFINESNGYGIKDQAKSEAALKKADEYFTKALPHLELAHEIRDSDVSIIRALMQLYAQTENLEKYKEMKAKL